MGPPFLLDIPTRAFLRPCGLNMPKLKHELVKKPVSYGPGQRHHRVHSYTSELEITLTFPFITLPLPPSPSTSDVMEGQQLCPATLPNMATLPDTLPHWAQRHHLSASSMTFMRLLPPTVLPSIPSLYGPATRLGKSSLPGTHPHPFIQTSSRTLMLQRQPGSALQWRSDPTTLPEAAQSCCEGTLALRTGRPGPQARFNH